VDANERDADPPRRPAPDTRPQDRARTGEPVDAGERPSVALPGPQFMTSRRTDWRTRMSESSPDTGAARPQVHDLRRVLRNR
jgi:hypothetical protein